ncbi:type II toxin-antitoxin system VapC family toxin [Azospirillum sp. ST 5-10]|uniref:type II toxin-antitoxin system VapC family toxin n=1 Tax=unclassified Azospirillum TaxID=2630922 RepID=UPI003F49C67F
MTLVDTNVLLDVVTDDPVWGSWSLQRLEAAGLGGALLINAVIYAELSIGYDRIEDLDAVLADAGITVEPIPRDALFLAGKAFLSYRATGGTKTGVLPDFFIGAHAAVADLALLTRDVRRYRRHFPTVRLIAPDR